MLTACSCLTNISYIFSSFSPEHVKFTVYFVLLNTMEGVLGGWGDDHPRQAHQFSHPNHFCTLPLAWYVSSMELPTCNSQQ